MSTSELRAIFERLPEAALVADDQRHFLAVNEAAVALLELARARIVGLRIDDLVDPRSHEVLRANWDALLAAGTQTGEMVLQLPGPRRIRITFQAAANVQPGRHVFLIRRASAQGDFSRVRRLEEEAHIHAAHLRRLSEASRAFAEAGTGLGALLDAIARQIAAVFGCGAGVGLSTSSGRGLVMRKLHHPDPEALAALRAARVPSGAGAAVDQVLRTGQSLVVAIPETGDVAAGPPPVRALMLAPLRTPHRIAGAVWVARERADRPFTPRDLATLEDLAERATLAIENARALRRARRAKERTLRLQAVTAAVAGPLTVTAVADVVLRAAHESLGAASGVLYRLAEDGGELELVAVTGSLAQCRDRISRVPLDGPFVVPHAVREGRPILLSNRAERDRLYGTNPGADSVESGAVAAVPLLVHGRAIGGLGLTFTEERTWKNEDAVFLSALARHTAQAFERARLFERAERARREAEQAASTKEQMLALLNTLFASAPVGLAFLDRELRYRRVNRTLAAINGVTPDEHLGRTVRELLPELADQLEPALRQVLATGKPSVDLEVSGATPAAPGVVRHFVNSYYPVRADDDRRSPIIGVGVVRSEVTTQKRTADTMALLAGAGAILSAPLDRDSALNDLARLVVPSLGDWCAVEIIERGEAKLVAVAHSDPAKVDLAREVRRLYPPLPRDPQGVFEVARHKRSQLLAEVDDTTLTSRARNEEHLRMGRELAPRSAIVVPLIAGGRGFGALTLVAAESRRRYGPADVAMVEELAHRAALAVENARLFADVRDAVRVREEFLSIAGHELKTPLTALKLQLEGLARLAQRPGDIDKKAALARLEGTLRQSERLEKLVNQLLDVSRIAAGRLALDREEVDLAAVARDVGMRFADEAARSGSTLALDVGGPLFGWWDRLRLDQVVSNLISNAVKYGRGLPIEISARSESGDTALLEVRDHGIGIPPENQARIFGRFERAVPERHYGGFGLGLWIARQLIDAHGGSIAVESAPGEGSRFTVRLPRNDRRERGAQQAPATVSAST